MTSMELTYSGNKRTSAKHLASNNQIITDAPIDNNGKGEAFSPTDLLCSSLVSCMMTIMAISAEKHNFKFENCKANITKHMGVDPRRIVKIDIDMVVTGSYSDKEKKILLTAAKNCPVAKSINPEIEQNLNLTFRN